MRCVVKALKTVNYRLWFAILATMLLPTVYQTVRIFFLGDMPSDSGINIASQLQCANYPWGFFSPRIFYVCYCGIFTAPTSL